MLNDGLLDIYIKTPSKSDTGMALEVLELVGNAFYGEISFTVNEYYTAKQEGSLIQKRIRIHEDKTIGNSHVIELDGVQYQVGRTYSAVVKGIAVTDITLEKLATQYGKGGDGNG